MGALDGIRVLDLTRVRAGPTATRALADFGADVIRIEPPEGMDPNAEMAGPRHGYDNLNLQRNKRSLTLNLKAPEARAIFAKLVETADVVIENFRPDVKDRLGLDYESLKRINPRIVLASVSGFGQTGPAALRGGFDQIAQGMGGLMWVTGHAGQGPVRAGIAVADSAAGIYTAFGIMVALHERARTGLGQWVQTSLLEAMIGFMDFQAARYLVDGAVPGQAGNDHPYLTPTGVFATSDGFINLAVAGEGTWAKFCAAIGREDWLARPEYRVEKDRLANRPALKADIEAVFAARTSAEWLELLEAAGVPAGPIYRMDEVFADPQVAHLGIAARTSHPARGDIRLVGPPVTLSRTPAAIAKPAPDLGADSAELLRELGYDDDEIARLKAARLI